MNQLMRDQLWIVLAAGVVFFTNLGAAALWDLDEPLYAACAREMLDRGDWVVPRYNGEPFFDKPPLMFWLMMGGAALFGWSEFAVRFWSPVLGIATALATYHLGRLLFRREVGFWAGIVTATSIIFTVSARAATVDTALTLATTLTVLAFVTAMKGRQKADGRWQKDNNAPGHLPHSLSPVPCPLSHLPSPICHLPSAIFMYAFMAVAVLAKGPVGLLLPAATVGLVMLLVNRRRHTTETPPATYREAFGRALRTTASVFSPGNFLRSLWQLRPLTAIVVVAAVALPWYVLVGLRTDGAWLQEFFAKYNLRPFVKPFMGHYGPWYYHFVAVVIGFFPWSLFIGPAIAHLARQIRRETPYAFGAVVAACWIGVWFGFWSLCSTKLPHYVLPAYPALALMTGMFLADWLAEPVRFKPYWGRNASVTLMLVGVAVLIAVPIIAARFVPGEELIGLVGLVPLVGGGVCWWLSARGRLRPMLGAFSVSAVVFLTALFAFAAVRVDRHQHSPSLVAAARDARPDPQPAAYRFLQASMVYYAGAPMPWFHDGESLRRFVAESPQAVIFTSSQFEEEIERELPGQLEVLARRPRFLGRGDVLVLGRRGAMDTAQTPGRMTSRR